MQKPRIFFARASGPRDFYILLFVPWIGVVFFEAYKLIICSRQCRGLGKSISRALGKYREYPCILGSDLEENPTLGISIVSCTSGNFEILPGCFSGLISNSPKVSFGGCLRSKLNVSGFTNQGSAVYSRSRLVDRGDDLHLLVQVTHK